MARDESSREDLLREATALTERIEFAATGVEPIVAGFRSNGAFSIFFGEDPAFHFNVAGELRRAYHGGLLIKAANGRLVSLRRERTAHETQLLRHDLTSDEQTAFLAETEKRLIGLLGLLRKNALNVIGQVPADANVLNRVLRWLESHPVMHVALQPNL